jgi:hypothetical protein
MVDDASSSYRQGMAPKLLRLAHAELCDGCADLLPVGTAVTVDASCHVRCASCARRHDHLVEHDPWSPIEDPELRDRLHHRSSAIGQLISA